MKRKNILNLTMVTVLTIQSGVVPFLKNANVNLNAASTVSVEQHNNTKTTIKIPATITTKEAALDYLQKNGFPYLTLSNIENLKAGVQLNSNTKYGTPNVTPSNYHAIGNVEEQRGESLPTGEGWTLKGEGDIVVDTTKQSITIPANAQINSHQLLSKTDVFNWLKANGQSWLTSEDQITIKSGLATSVPNSKFVSTISDIPQGYELDSSYTWIQAATQLVVATGTLAPTLTESEQAYRNRMQLLGYEVLEYKHTQDHYDIPGTPNATRQQAEQYAQDHSRHWAQYNYDIHKTAFELDNHNGATRQFSSILTFLSQNNQDSSEARKVMAPAIIGDLISTNRIPGLNLSDSKYQDIDSQTGLPKFVVNMLLNHNSADYYKKVLGTDHPDMSQYLKENRSEYAKNFDDAVKFLHELTEKIKDADGLPADVKSSIEHLLNDSLGGWFGVNKNVWHLTTNDGVKHDFDSLVAFNDFVIGNPTLLTTKSTYTVSQFGKDVQTFTNRNSAQDFITNSINAVNNDPANVQYAPKYDNGQISGVSNDLTDTQVQNLKQEFSSNGKLWKVVDNNRNVVFYKTEQEAINAVLALNKQIATNAGAKLSNLSQTEKSDLNREISNATSTNDLESILSKYSGISDTNARNSDRETKINNVITMINRWNDKDAKLSKDTAKSLIDNARNSSNSELETALNKAEKFEGYYQAIAHSWGLNSNDKLKSSLSKLLKFDDNDNNDKVIALLNKALNVAEAIRTLPNLSDADKKSFISKLDEANSSMLNSTALTFGNWDQVYTDAFNKSIANKNTDAANAAQRAAEQSALDFYKTQVNNLINGKSLTDGEKANLKNLVNQKGTQAEVEKVLKLAFYVEQVHNRIIHSQNLTDIQKKSLDESLRTQNSKEGCQNVLNKVLEVEAINKLVDSTSTLTNAQKQEIKNGATAHNLDQVKNYISNVKYEKDVRDKIASVQGLTNEQKSNLNNLINQTHSNMYGDNLNKFNSVIAQLNKFAEGNLIVENNHAETALKNQLINMDINQVKNQIETSDLKGKVLKEINDNASKITSEQKNKLVQLTNSANGLNSFNDVLNKLYNLIAINEKVDAISDLTDAQKLDVKNYATNNRVSDVENKISNLLNLNKFIEYVKSIKTLTPSEINSYINRANSQPDVNALNNLANEINSKSPISNGVNLFTQGGKQINLPQQVAHNAESVRDGLGLLISDVSGVASVDEHKQSISGEDASLYKITGNGVYQPTQEIKDMNFNTREDAIKYLLDHDLVQLKNSNGERVSLTNDLQNIEFKEVLPEKLVLNVTPHHLDDISSVRHSSVLAHYNFVPSTITNKENVVRNTVEGTKSTETLSDTNLPTLSGLGLPSHGSGQGIGTGSNTQQYTRPNIGSKVLVTPKFDTVSLAFAAPTHTVPEWKVYESIVFDITKLDEGRITKQSVRQSETDYRINPLNVGVKFTSPDFTNLDVNKWTDLINKAFDKQVIIPSSTGLQVGTSENIQDYLNSSGIVKVINSEEHQTGSDVWNINEIRVGNHEELISEFLKSRHREESVSAKIKQLVPIKKTDYTVEIPTTHRNHVYWRQNYGVDEVDAEVTFETNAPIISKSHTVDDRQGHYLHFGIPDPRPNAVPHLVPTPTPHMVPGRIPNAVPNRVPMLVPTLAPHLVPTPIPHMVPSLIPNAIPNRVPMLVPTLAPHLVPTPIPHMVPGLIPNAVPNRVPMLVPTLAPHLVPTPTPNMVPGRTPQPLPYLAPKLIPTPNENLVVPPKPDDKHSPSGYSPIHPNVEKKHSPSGYTPVHPNVEKKHSPSGFVTKTPKIDKNHSPSGFVTNTPHIDKNHSPSGYVTNTPNVNNNTYTQNNEANSVRGKSTTNRNTLFVFGGLLVIPLLAVNKKKKK